MTTHLSRVAAWGPAEGGGWCESGVLEEGVEMARAGRPVGVSTAVVGVDLLLQSDHRRAVRPRVVHVHRVARPAVVRGAAWCPVIEAAFVAADRGPVLGFVD